MTENEYREMERRIELIELALEIKRLELDTLFTALGVETTDEALQKIKRLTLAYIRQN